MNINAETEHLEGGNIKSGTSQVVECINNGKYALLLQYKDKKQEEEREIIEDIKSIMLSLILSDIGKKGVE